MDLRSEQVEVDGGAVPVRVQGRAPSDDAPGLVVVPSIFGPAPDLLERLAPLAQDALVVVADPFWREGGGVVPYDDFDGAFQRLHGFDRDRCLSDMRAVIAWTKERCNGRVVGVGICFGGPIVLTAAAEGALSGVVTWHGSRMENFLDGADQISCPLRFHFGAADPVTPPEAIEKLQEVFASHPDAVFVVYPGLEHGFSHDGRSYDATATQAGIDDTRDLLAALRGRA
jgi:carboxymethylenebutenolidase